MRLSWILTLSLLTPIIAQTPPAEAGKNADAKTTNAAVKKLSPIEQLRTAEEAGREAALIRFIDTQLATGAIYSDQYAALSALDWDATPMLRAWMVKAPAGPAASATMFRDGCINALRDCVDEASDELLAELQTLATTHGVPDRLATNAKYALAQFGKTDHVDAMIAAAKENTAATEVNTKIRAWSQLADIYYHMRRYEDAAKAHREVITGIEAANPHFQGLPSSYYNCACSYALLGKKEAALEHLSKALQLGKKANNQLGIELIQNDMDIRTLRREPKFKELMKEYFDIEPKRDATGDPEKTEPKKAGPDKI